MIAVRKSIGLKNQSRQLATPGHVIFAYNIVQRCLSLLVWLLGVDYVLCTSCTTGSKGHRLSGSLLWVYVTISIFRGVGLSFHAFNESRPPCSVEFREAVAYSLSCLNERNQASSKPAQFLYKLPRGLQSNQNAGAHSAAAGSKANLI